MREKARSVSTFVAFDCPFFVQIDFEERLRKEATVAYEKVFVAALKPDESSPAASVKASKAAATEAARVLGVQGSHASRVALLPPVGKTSHPSPRVSRKACLPHSAQQAFH